MSDLKAVKEFEFGIQPLDLLMEKFKLSNTDLVDASTKQLTHKMVAKARRGRRLTNNIQNKILEALKSLRPDEKLTLKDLFNVSSI